MNKLINSIYGDKYIWSIAIGLSAISLLAVYSSTSLLGYKENKFVLTYLIKHASVIISGLIIMYITHLINYKYYIKLSNILIVIAVPLLLYTLLFGTSINEASRWIRIPIIDKTFQTSDFAKFALFIYLAKELAFKQKIIKDFKSGFLPIIAAIIVICVLVAPSNLSTAIMIFATSMLLLVIGRVSFTQILLLIMCGAVIISLTMMYGPRKEVYKNRLEAFISPGKHDLGKNYQRKHAKIAISSGGVFGKGPGNSTQRNYLPSPYADFIFAIIIEEYGLIGASVVVFLYLALLARVIKISLQTDNAFAALLVVSLGFSLVIQALLNMAVAVNLLPVTGVSLPLISMGGPSIVFTCITFGIILNISRTNYTNENKRIKFQ
ncbi:MAG: FtsW/RodA/SpoVE family cell cycle protein [Solitalea-like symbiont of Acarus siro]